MNDRSNIVFSIAPPDAVRGVPKFPGRDSEGVMVELRADRLSSEEVTRIVESSPAEMIVTARPRSEGGEFAGSEAERIALLEAALRAGARWIDVELGSEAARLAEGADAARVILSDHGAPCERSALEQRLRLLGASAASRLKLVARAQRPDEIVALRDLLRDHGDDRLCAFALGAAGSLSRLLALAWGSWGTYAAAGRGAETASGQFTFNEMTALYDVRSITASTRIVALVGAEIYPRSPSPAMHNAGYRAIGLDARYLPLECERWEAAWTVATELGFAGLAVTMPFKGEALGALARVDELGLAAAAINTIVFDARGPSGANTDGPGALDCLQKRGLAPGDSIDVLGAGGTARAIAAALRAAGHRPVLWSRRGTDGRLLSERASGSPDWLVHATPLRDRTWAEGGRAARKGVLDAAYGARATALVRHARDAGLAVADGLDLLVAQAELQFELQTGQKPPPGLLAEAGQRYLDGLG